MALELSTRPVDTGTTEFSPANHLLGIVQGIVASQNEVRILLPGKGEIAIRPARAEYHANAQDLPDFCRADAAEFKVIPLNETAPAYVTGPGRDLKELLWSAAFHASEGRLVEGASKYDVVQFRHWPNLTRLPTTPNAARICALLTRHPTTVMLIHRVLGIDKAEVCQIYSAAHCAGITSTISQTPKASSAASEAAPSEPAQERSLFRSLFAKISGL